MFKKLVATLLTATTIFSGISAFNSTRFTAEPVQASRKTERKLDYSAEQDYSYADAFISDIADWNTDGVELAIMTNDGYEFYAYKATDEYSFNKNYVAFDEIADVEKANGEIRIITKDGNVYEVSKEE